MCIYVHYIYTCIIHLWFIIGISYLIATAATCSNYIQQFSTASSTCFVMEFLSRSNGAAIGQQLKSGTLMSRLVVRLSYRFLKPREDRSSYILTSLDGSLSRFTVVFAWPFKIPTWTYWQCECFFFFFGRITVTTQRVETASAANQRRRGQFQYHIFGWMHIINLNPSQGEHHWHPLCVV